MVPGQLHGENDIDHGQGRLIRKNQRVALVVLHLVQAVIPFLFLKGLSGCDVGGVFPGRVIQLVGGGLAVKVQHKAGLCGIRRGGEHHVPVRVQRHLKFALHGLATALQDFDQAVQHGVAVGGFGVSADIADGHGVGQLVVGQYVAVYIVDDPAGSRGGHAALRLLQILVLIIGAV